MVLVTSLHHTEIFTSRLDPAMYKSGQSKGARVALPLEQLDGIPLSLTQEALCISPACSNTVKQCG